MEQTSLIMRNDTLLGVCQAIGDDFGFSPLLLRVPFAACLLLNPLLVVGVYLGLGVLVLASRWVYPSRRSAARVEAGPAQPANEAEPLQIAA
jgi:phage shock protein PspC (stress-responsive transcriptional regulator)